MSVRSPQNPPDGPARLDPGGTANGLRSDARENRERILRAAREAYAAQGIDVPLTTIARRAGVGIATLYRRFPTRAALMAEVFGEQLAQCTAELHKALQDPDPWNGFRSFVEKVGAMQTTDRGLTSALLSHFPDAAGHDHGHIEELLARLVQRAKDAGKLRADFHLGDIALVLLANCGVIGGAGDDAPAASRRLVAYLLQSFQADHGTPLPRPAPLELRRVYAPSAS
ncbi:TetR/AcrR family transcriptional regulator [Marinactinospora thermotolerans]|uniref:Transcriptional regulator, TetR family n=1 Tax=Marinactinospora thermotolerans DSM 45154 TaxID=1122192 RepID=A0A1T4PP95_9ACTN|nr:TetR/AcrR family transcriptional regulator [Marinactinospora thermotolerans]SJZ93037.1 transcriptional regulator, TetR family [Marinactinospora thermotolerans DSM 45154]